MPESDHTFTYHYLLSGNAEMWYDAPSNGLTLRDIKNGDYVYARQAYTNSVCGSSGDACAPPSSSQFTLQSTAAGAEDSLVLQPGTMTYVLLKLCNDDTPPDTCSTWKRTGA
jgi:hypothetical protein